MSLYNNVLNELQYYILNDENIEKSLRMKINNDKQNNDKQNNDKQNNDNKVYSNKVCVKKPDIFVPYQQDTLFWCFYIIKNGEIDYELLNNKNSLLAKQQKIELITNTIRKNKTIIKMYKFDTLSNHENNLANDYNLNIQTFLTLCAIENINIIYVNNKTYFELLMNDSNNIYIIHNLKSMLQNSYKDKYGFEIATENKIANIKDTLYKLENINKTIKAISSYKVQDLIEICTKLAIEFTNKENGKIKSKKDLYESIIQYF